MGTPILPRLPEQIMFYCWNSENDFKLEIEQIIASTPVPPGLTQRQYRKLMWKAVKKEIAPRFDPITWLFIAIKIYQAVRIIIDYFYTTNRPTV